MERRLFNDFRELIYNKAGISLGDDKIPLLTNRIGKRIRALQLKDAAQYYQIVQADDSGSELLNLIDVVSTNVTYFNREAEHFELLGNIFAEWGKQSLKVWCAAASSGEEPYTIVITAREKLDLERVDFRLLATDICLKALSKGVAGIYDEKQMERLPNATKHKYFTREGDRHSPLWRVTPDLKRYVLFKRLNLSSFPYPLKPAIDIIFCRNVMIYFDLRLRQKIITEFERLLNPGGYLFLSRSENLLGIKHSLQSADVSVYRKLI